MSLSRRLVVGYVLIILGFSMLLAGVSVYLEGPSNQGTGNIVLYHEECNSGCWIGPGKFTYREFGMNRTGPVSVVIRSFYFDAALDFNGTVNVQVMNSSFYERWNANRSLHSGLDYGKVQRLSLHFVPTYNDTFYLVLGNPNDSRETMSYSYSLVASVILYDFSKAFFGLDLAAVGIILIGLATAFGNPVFRVLRAFFLRYRLKLGAGSLYSQEENRYSAAFSARAQCAVLIGYAVIWFAFFGSIYSMVLKTPGLTAAPALLRNVVIDIAVRYTMLWVPMLLVIAFLFLITQLFGTALRIFVARRLGLVDLSRLSLLRTHYFWRTWVHGDSLIGLAIGCGSLMVALDLVTNGIGGPFIPIALVVLGISTLALILGRNGYLSLDQACDDLKISFAKEFRISRLTDSISWSFGILQVIILFLAMAMSLSYTLNFVGLSLFKWSYLGTVPTAYDVFSAGVVAEVISALNYFNSHYLLYASSFFALIGISYAFLIPIIFTPQDKKRLLGRYGSFFVAFVISYLSQIILSTLFTQPSQSSYVQIVTSVLIAIVAQFLSETYAAALSR